MKKADAEVAEFLTADLRGLSQIFQNAGRAGLRLGFELAPLAFWQVAEGVGADGFAVEGGDFCVEAEEHAFYLVVLAFVDGEAALARREQRHFGGRGGDVFLRERHAGLEGVDGFG